MTDALELLKDLRARCTSYGAADIDLAIAEIEKLRDRVRRYANTVLTYAVLLERNHIHAEHKLKIGLDLDGVCTGRTAEFMRELVEGMTMRGHAIYCTSGWGRDNWESHIEPKLKDSGFDTAKINPSLLTPTQTIHITDKARMADQLDVVFDDDAGRIQLYTDTPIMFVPRGRAYYCASIQ